MYEHRDDIQPRGSAPPTDRGPRNLKWGLIAAVVVTLIAAVPGILLDRNGGTKQVTTAQPFLPTTTTTTVASVQPGDTTPLLPAPTTTVKKGVVTPVLGVPRDTGTTTTTTAKVCRNSYDPKCGPFRWDPDPGPNQPLTVTVTPETQQGTAGHEVNFHVVAKDPDAKIDSCVAIEFGDDDKHPTCPTQSCQTPYGPWTPPAKVPDQVTVDIKHAYATARAEPYIATFRYQSRSFCNPDPLRRHRINRRPGPGLGVRREPSTVAGLAGARRGRRDARRRHSRCPHRLGRRGTPPGPHRPTSQQGPPVGTVTPVVGDPGGPQPDPTVAAAPTTTTPANVLGVSFTRTSTTSVTPVISPPKPASTTTTSTATCRNSTDPSCGPFRWDPDPGSNQPLTGEVTYSPASPKAGDEVTFHITASDPDDDHIIVCSADYGGSEGGYVCDPAEAMNPSLCPKQYGPWTPPARKQGTLDRTDHHTYANAGTYEASFSLHSGGYCSSDPYASSTTLKTTVTVIGL